VRKVVVMDVMRVESKVEHSVETKVVLKASWLADV